LSPAKTKTHRPRPSGRSGPRKRPSRRPGAEATTRPRPENPEALALARRAASVLGSGDSERGVVATAEHVRETLKAEGHRTIGTEGFDTGHWVLLDYGEVVVHVFFTEVRAFYDLDGLWADAPKEKAV
jgi:ribosome-associated protein